MFKILRQIFESLRFAWQSVIVNKMRTFLSLLGITIGIFAIISVYTAIDSIERYIRSNFDAFGTNTVYIGKWPWVPEGDGEYKRWKYINRPTITLTERLELADALGDKLYAYSVIADISRIVKYEKSSRSGTAIIGVDYDYEKVNSMSVEFGRYFSPFECESGRPVAVIGAVLAEDIFEGVDPVGKQIKLGDRTVNVIGVFKKEGENMMGFSNDSYVIVPVNFMKTMANLKTLNNFQVMYKCKESVSFEDFKLEIESNMRRIRRISPEAENNFSINVMDAISSFTDQIFGMLNLVGGIIGLFSILVGGFGVANIMFVSVAERTSQIGVQKALGAKPYAILLQFIFEAIMLAIVGGALGLLLIWIAAIIINSLFEFQIILTFENIMIGLVISSVVGAVSGFFPAWKAAKMQPVQAIYKTN